MNVYWCELPSRNVGRSYEPPDPGEDLTPCGFYVAETRGKAKTALLDEWCERHGWYPPAAERDEFTEIRCLLLLRDVDWPAGPAPEPGEDEFDDSQAFEPNGKIVFAEPWETIYSALDAKRVTA